MRKISIGLDGYNRVDFEVESYWKSPGTNRISVKTSLNEAGCGYPFRVGTKYLVYAHSNPLQTGICQRTKSFEKAAVDLAALGAGVQPTQITGSGVNSNYLIGVGVIGFLAGICFLRLRNRRRLIRA